MPDWAIAAVRACHKGASDVGGPIASVEVELGDRGALPGDERRIG